MAAGVRGDRGLAARRGRRGPRRRAHSSVRPPQRGCSAAAPAMGGRRTLGRGRARARRAASRARAFLRWRSRATAGKAEGTEGAAGQNGAILLPPLPQPPSPPPPGGSSPAESRPPAALTLHCDPRGGGAGRGAPGSRPQSRPRPAWRGPGAPGWGEGAPGELGLGAAPAAGYTTSELGSAKLQAENGGLRSSLCPGLVRSPAFPTLPRQNISL